MFSLLLTLAVVNAVELAPFGDAVAANANQVANDTFIVCSYCRLRTSMNGSWQVKGNENECIIDGIRQRRRKKQSNTRGAPWEKGNQTKTSVSAGKTKKKKKGDLHVTCCS
jgi:ribosomal protein L44E